MTREWGGAATPRGGTQAVVSVLCGVIADVLFAIADVLFAIVGVLRAATYFLDVFNGALDGVLNSTGGSEAASRAVFRGRWGTLGHASGREVVPVAIGDVVSEAQWRALCLAALNMPPAAGRRWLAEVESFLTEAPPKLRLDAARSYLAHAPQFIVVSWITAAARERPASSGGR